MEFLENISPREYQQKIFETCKDFNTLVVIPTGLGKTLIALMLSIHKMKEYPGEKVLFLAPTKPLAEQHQEYFKKHLPELFGEITLFTGAVKADQRKKLFQQADIIFSTPQCIANDIKKRLYNLSEVCLLIEDEAHRCLKNYDYNFVAKEYKMQRSENTQRIVGLTASPGSEKSKIKDICRNLNIEKVEVKTREDEDVKKYLQELTFEKYELDFPTDFNEMRHLLKKIYEDYVEELRSRRILFGPAGKIQLIELQKKLMATIARGNSNFNSFHGASACAQAIKIQHAMELLETQTLSGFANYLKKIFDEAAKGKSKGVKKLVAKPEFNFVHQRANELLFKKMEHPKVFKINEIITQEKKLNDKTKIIIFTQFRETAAILAKNINSLEGQKIKAKIFVGQAKKKIKEVTSGLSQKEQKAMIDEFSQGKINVLVSTSIGEEGLDIPEVNAVIFYEPVPSAIRKIQRTGRTARLKEGKLIMLITKNTRDEVYHWAAFHKEKRMKSAIDSIKNELEDGTFHNKVERQSKL